MSVEPQHYSKLDQRFSNGSYLTALASYLFHEFGLSCTWPDVLAPRSRETKDACQKCMMYQVLLNFLRDLLYTAWPAYV